MLEPYFASDDGRHVIYCGDCLEIMPQLEAGSVDAVVTDPPYGVGLKERRTKHTVRQGQYDAAFEDTPEYVSTVCASAIVYCRDTFGRVVLTCGTRNLFKYPEPDDLGCIFVPEGAGRGRWGFTCSQPILYYGKSPYLSNGMGGRPTSFEIHATAEDNGHPCPKPVLYMTRLVTAASLEEECVLDPFCGSGTTLVACVKTNRRSIGIEISEQYCEIAKRRLLEALAQPQLPLEVGA